MISKDAESTPEAPAPFPPHVLEAHQDLNRRHQKEVAELQQQAQAEWMALVERHAVERQQFWSNSSNQSPCTSQQLNTRRTPDVPAKSRAEAQVTPAKPTAGAASTLSEIEIIDLTSDTETASFTSAFGNQTSCRPAKSQTQSVQSGIGAEEPVTRVKLQDESQSNRSGSFTLSNEGSGKIGAKATQSTLRKTGPLSKTTSPKKPLVPDVRTEIDTSTFRRQLNDPSSILKEPRKIPQDPKVLGLQQHKQDGGFVTSILHNRREQKWAPELGSVFQTADADVRMEDAPQAIQKKSLLVRLPAYIDEVDGIAKAQKALNNPTEASPFKVPALPSRDFPSSLAALNEKRGQRTREPSVASSVSTSRASISRSSVAALNKSQLMREGSVTSRFSTYSAPSTPSQSRKRKVVNLSDESDYSPSPPSSPESKVKSSAPKHTPMPKKIKSDVLGGRSANQPLPRTPPPKSGNRTMPSTPGAPMAKRNTMTARMSPPSPSIRAKSSAPKHTPMPKKIKSDVLGSRSANQPLPRTPPPKSSNRTMPSAPGAPVAKRTMAAPMSPPSPSLRASSAMRSKAARKLLSLKPSRRTALQAKEKIRQSAEVEATWRTEEQIRQATDKEDKLQAARTNTNEEQIKVMGRRLHRVSLTPTPSMSQTDGSADRSDPVYGAENWINDRRRGDRQIAKELGGAAREESDGEVDATGFKMVDGVVLRIEAEEVGTAAPSSDHRGMEV